MNILLTGGTGFIGSALVEHLVQHDHHVVLLTNKPAQATSHITYAKYPEAGKLLSPLLLQDLDAMINLAGHNISARLRWDEQTKKLILHSRLETTALLVESLKNCHKQGLSFPKILITASAIGYYGPNPQNPVTENSPLGSGFLADVCQQWEAEAQKAANLSVIVTRLRFGIVLGPKGGMLLRMDQPFRFGFGGIIGNGRNWVSWIHRTDLIHLIQYFLLHPESGVFNAAAPESVTMQEFGHALGQAMNHRSWTFVPAWLVRLGFGEFADEILLANQQVVPERLNHSNFVFQYPTIHEALHEIYQK